MSPYNLKRRFEMGGFGTNSSAQGVPWGMGGGGRDHAPSLGGMFLERVKRARKGFEVAIAEIVAGIVHVVPQHASLLSPVANVPSPTGLVPIFSLDYGSG